MKKFIESIIIYALGSIVSILAIAAVIEVMLQQIR